MLIRKRGEMVSLSRESDVIAISHYHLDHLSPQETDLRTTFSTRAYVDEVFADKVLLCKDPDNNVAERQGIRGRKFRRIYAGRAPEYHVADGGNFRFGQTEIVFSEPLWHGREGTVQGYVVGTCVRDGEMTVVHASDVQLLNGRCVEWMVEQEPDLAITAGPPLFDPDRMKHGEWGMASGLLKELSRGVPNVVVDHHPLRSPDWRDFLGEVPGVGCAAEVKGVPVLTLECERRSLYQEEEIEAGFHQQLANGRVPNRLRSVILEEGLERIYKGPLKW
jgi:predicted metallo-beta-lactamase superfamily hydrolase